MSGLTLLAQRLLLCTPLRISVNDRLPRNHRDRNSPLTTGHQGWPGLADSCSLKGPTSTPNQDEFQLPDQFEQPS